MDRIGLLKFYDSIEGTLVNGASNEAVTFTNVANSFYTLVTNDSSVNSFSVRLKLYTDDSFGDSITITAGETLVINDAQIQAIDMSNSSGAGITYRIVLMGL